MRQGRVCGSKRCGFTTGDGISNPAVAALRPSGAVVGRLPKPRRAARPVTARQFFALACRHLRWELSDRARRLDKQPQDEREAFDLVRIQGTSPSEAAEVLEVSLRTVNRRLHRGLQLLAATLGDLYPVLGRGGMGVVYAWRYEMSGHTCGKVVLDVSA